MSNIRRRKSNYIRRSFTHDFQGGIAGNRRSALQFWICEYANRLVSAYPLSYEIITLVFSLGSQSDLFAYVRLNSDWLIQRETPEDDDPHRARRRVLPERFDADDMAVLIDSYIERQQNSQAITKVTNSLKQFIRNISPKYEEIANSLPARTLQELSSSLKLNETETELLRFFFCMTLSNMSHISKGFHDMEKYQDFIHTLTGKPLRQIRQALDYRSRLISLGLITTEDKYFDGISVNFLINSDLAQCLIGNKTVAEFFEKHIARDRKKVFPLDSFSIPAEMLFIARRMLRAGEPVRMLVHGLTGTGKTEFVRSLCRSCDLPAYFLRQGADGTATDRKFYLEIANQLLTGQNAVIIIDEADELLNTRYRFLGYIKDSINKGWLNDFFDRANVTMIFISNDISAIEDSVLRRFHFNIKFDKKNRRSREKNWQQALEKKSIRPYLSESFIRRVMARYHLTPASLNNAIHALEVILQPEDYSTKTIENYFEEILANHESLVYKGRRRLAEILPDKYDPSLIHTDVPIEEIITALKNYIRNSENTGIGDGVNLLFWGLPGTGKTEFAKYLAQELGREIIVKRASDLLNPYVGVTEKLISQAFEEASVDKAILFVDEADSFFRHREQASHNWEITQTNEFLNQMENHNGILICCTNLLKHLDPAALRRFHWKVEFKPLRKEDRLAVFQRYFPDFSVKALEEKLLKMEDLTPGDFRAVYNKLRFRDLRRIKSADILKALAKETEYRRQQATKKISGFEH